MQNGARSAERPAPIDDDGPLRHQTGVIGDLAGETLAGLDGVAGLNPADLPVVEATPRLEACDGGTGKFMCFGLTYADHAAKSGMLVPSEPDQRPGLASADGSSFYTRKRLRSAHDGTPPAVVCLPRKDQTQPDQQAPRVA
jgi:hypothetical protein